MRAVIYHHSIKNDSLEQSVKQLNELQNFCQKRNFDIVQIYNDSKLKDDRRRPALAQMMKDAKHKKFDIVVVWSFDTLKKNTGLTDFKIITTLMDLGINFLSYQESFFDTLSCSNDMKDMIKWISVKENKFVNERKKAGMEKAKKRGILIGRPKIEIDVQKIIEMQKEGNSLRKIAKSLGVSKDTIRKALMNKKMD